MEKCMGFFTFRGAGVPAEGKGNLSLSFLGPCWNVRAPSGEAF